MLASSQHDLCRRFAQRVDGDRFDGVELAASRTGLPILAGALATFECETHAQYEAGDHVVLVGRVLHWGAGSGDALIFRAGRMLSSRSAVELH